MYLSNGSGRVDVGLFLCKVAGVPTSTNKIDNDVRVLSRTSDAVLVPEVPLQRNDLSQVSHHFQVVVRDFFSSVGNYNLRAAFGCTGSMKDCALLST